MAAIAAAARDSDGVASGGRALVRLRGDVVTITAVPHAELRAARAAMARAVARYIRACEGGTSLFRDVRAAFDDAVGETFKYTRLFVQNRPDRAQAPDAVPTGFTLDRGESIFAELLAVTRAEGATRVLAEVSSVSGDDVLAALDASAASRDVREQLPRAARQQLVRAVAAMRAD